MMRWRESWIAAVLVVFTLAKIGQALRGSELVLAAKAKAAEEKNNPTTEVISVIVNEDGTNSTVVKAKPLLTGNPQQDYIHDPNLPRELKGHNLTNYPFYNAVPEDIEFECDGLHDGFYASVPHHCQLYHHCLFGTRYDFLCANYTAFDQKTFICHFVSEVDCANSPKYYKRNEALYKQATSAPPTTTTTAKPSTAATTVSTTSAPPPRKSGAGRRRRPSYRRRRPIYEYYYDDEEYDEEYYDEEEELPPPRKSGGRRHHHRPQGGRREDQQKTTTSTTTSTTSPAPPSADAPLTRAPLSVYAPRALPKIKRPVPINEKSKYDYTTKAGTNVVKPTSNPRAIDDDEEEDVEDYDDDDDYFYYYKDLPPPPPPKKKNPGKNGRRRAPVQERKRPSRFDDYDDEEEEEEERPRMRKGNRKSSMEEDRRTPIRGGYNSKNRKGHRDEEYEPIPSERPGYISGRGNSRKRYQEERMKKPDRWRSQEYEYHDEESAADSSRFDHDRRRPSRPKTEKMRPRSTKRTTTVPTTTTKLTPEASFEDEEDYEEYDDPLPIEEDIKSKPAPSSGFNRPTTMEPHRYSTTSYKSSTQTVQTTTEPITRQKTQPVTYRRNKLEFRRPTTKSYETTMASIVVPAGFVKQEGENKPLKNMETVIVPKRPDTSREVTPFKLSLKNEDSFSGDVRNQEKSQENTREGEFYTNKKGVDQVAPLPDHPRISDRPNNSFSHSDGHTYYVSSDLPFNQQQNRSKFESNPPLRKIPKPQGFPISLPGFERKPDDDYRKFQRPGAYTPSAPENIPIVQVYRRPFAPTKNDQQINIRRPVEETVVRRPLKQDNFSPIPTGYENSFKRPYAVLVENESNRAEEQRKPNKQEDPVANSEFIRRPGDGMPITAAGFRRGVRPMDKDKKKPLEMIGFPGRKTKENPTTPEPVTEVGPNYRNPFSFPRPLKDEPEYFKPPKTVEFTAPGPSADGSTQRPFPVYDIDEEYDVTLNDALQPSTLNPTLQYARIKSRGYQSAVTHPSYQSLILPSASQTFYSKTPAHNANNEYETVVVPATGYNQAKYKQRGPQDWFW